MRTISISAIFLLVAGVATAQNRATELQARSYIQSAFITGAAHAILSNDVALGPQLRERLTLPANADRDRIYESIFALTEDRTLRVRRLSGEEAGRPRFALEGGAVPLLVVYDLERNAIPYVALLGAQTAATAIRLKPILFAFNEAALSAEAKAQLEHDGLPKVAELRAVRYVVQGHGDRLGSIEYNQRLSELRALAVRDYLVERGVPPQSIQAVGLGASVSQTSCEEKSGRALIECLAPDRRVSVEIQPPPM